MKCPSFRKNIHDFLNQSLPPKESIEMQKHLEECSECQALYQEYQQVKSFLSEKHKLPSSASQRSFRKVLISSRWNLFKELALARDWVWIYWRDLDSRFIWSKVYALPLTLALFAVTLLNLHLGINNFSPCPDMSFAGVNGEEDILDHSAPPPSFRTVAVRQSRLGINRLVTTARKTPYDDSLFVVAEITPEGNAEIGDILEYPKNPMLLDVMDATLQQSQFEKCNQMDDTLVLVSFYKIDVWEGHHIAPYLQCRLPN